MTLSPAPFVANAKVVGVVDGEGARPEAACVQRNGTRVFARRAGIAVCATRVRITEIQA